MVDKRIAWTDAEKAAVLFQLIPQSIPWNTIVLPEGRTLKAVQIMISKEKEKLKKARDGQGEEGVEDGWNSEVAQKATSLTKKRGVSEALGEQTESQTIKRAKAQKVVVKDEPVV